MQLGNHICLLKKMEWDGPLLMLLLAVSVRLMLWNVCQRLRGRENGDGGGAPERRWDWRVRLLLMGMWMLAKSEWRLEDGIVWLLLAVVVALLLLEGRMVELGLGLLLLLVQQMQVGGLRERGL
jgi:hypothetical protein